MSLLGTLMAAEQTEKDVCLRDRVVAARFLKPPEQSVSRNVERSLLVFSEQEQVLWNLPSKLSQPDIVAVHGGLKKSPKEPSKCDRCKSSEHGFYPFKVMVFSGHGNRVTQSADVELPQHVLGCQCSWNG